MPYIDYALTANKQFSKEALIASIPRSLLLPRFDFGNDKRTWNKKQLSALKLLLCNLVRHGQKDKGVFLYSRDKRRLPPKVNSSDISYSSLFFVIDSLVQAKILRGKKAKPRTKGNNPKKLSEFTVTKQALQLAHSLGIFRGSIKSHSKQHLRLRELDSKRAIDFQDNEYTHHTEALMKDYCNFLNKHSITLSTWNYETEGISNYGVRGKQIHLYRNYSAYDAKHKQELERFWTEGCNPNFLLGGRSGSLWHGAKREDRLFILINGNESRRIDFPCSHINLCYRQETSDWHQTLTFSELKKQGRDTEDAYIVSPSLSRELVKKMVQLMLNVKGRNAVSNVFNRWLRQENKNEDRNAPDDLVKNYKQAGNTNVQIMELIEKKHQKIKGYFYKGKLAGQIIQWEEANFIHHLAHRLQMQFGFPVLTVYDELIVEKQYKDLVKEQMFLLDNCNTCSKYSLMSQL